MIKNRFKGEIYSRFGSIASFAEKLGWSRQKLSYIVNGLREPSLSDVQDIAVAMDMDVMDVASFFLSNASQK